MDISQRELDKPELKEMLLGGRVAEFNAYRKRCPDHRIDLTDLVLADARLDGIDLESAILRGTVFQKCSLQYAIFDDASAQRSVFIDCDLDASNAVSTSFHRARFIGGSARSGCWFGADVSRAEMSCDIADLRLYRADCFRTDFTNAINADKAHYDGANVWYAVGVSKEALKLILGRIEKSIKGGLIPDEELPRPDEDAPEPQDADDGDDAESDDAETPNSGTVPSGRSLPDTNATRPGTAARKPAPQAQLTEAAARELEDYYRNDDME